MITTTTRMYQGCVRIDVRDGGQAMTCYALSGDAPEDLITVRPLRPNGIIDLAEQLGTCETIDEAVVIVLESFAMAVPAAPLS